MINTRVKLKKEVTLIFFGVLIFLGITHFVLPHSVYADAPNITVYVYVDGQRFNPGTKKYYVEFHSGPTEWQKSAWGAGGKNTWGTVWYRVINSTGSSYFPSWQRNFPIDNYCYEFMMDYPGCRYDCRNRPKIDHDANSSTLPVYNAFALTSGYSAQAKLIDGNDWHNAWCYSDGYGCGSLSIPNIGVRNRFKALLPENQYTCQYTSVNNINNSQNSFSVNVFCNSINKPPNVLSISSTASACTISGTSWTGRSVGNPMNFRIRYIDSDGVSDIKQVGIDVDGIQYLKNVYNGNVTCSKTTTNGITLLGCSVSRSGNNLFVNWRIRFDYKEGLSLPIRGYVSDGLTNSGWKRLLNWNVDLTSPSGSVVTNIESATRLRMLWAIRDTLSGIYKINRDCGTEVSDYTECFCSGSQCFAGRDIWRSPYAQDPVMNVGTNWTHSDVDSIRSLATLGDVQYRAITQDKACNTITLHTTKGLGSRWMRTSEGDVFSQSGYSVSIPNLVDNRDFLSTYISSYLSTPAEFGAGGASNNLFKLYRYSDKNTQHTSLYDYFLKIARSNLGNITQLTSWPLPGNGVYMWSGGDLVLSNAQCAKRAVIFIPNRLIIHPDLKRIGSTTGCVFIVKGQIQIRQGGSNNNTYTVLGSSVQYDQIDAFLLSDGTFRVLADANHEQIFIHGGVITHNIQFRRDLVLEDNLLFSAERISYDARYLDILREYLGLGYSFRVKEFGYSR